MVCRVVGRGREAVTQGRRSDASRREELLVVERDNLRAAASLEVALEVGRHIDGADRLARSYRSPRRTEFAATLYDNEPRRRRNLFDEEARGLRPVLVDDEHP